MLRREEVHALQAKLKHYGRQDYLEGGETKLKGQKQLMRLSFIVLALFNPLVHQRVTQHQGIRQSFRLFLWKHLTLDDQAQVRNAALEFTT